MLTQRSEAELLALLVFSSLPDEVTFAEAQEILLACGELDKMNITEYIYGLESGGHIYIKDRKNEKYVGMTESGQLVAAAFAEKKQLFRSPLNKSLRCYKKIVCGIDYRIDLVKTNGGSNVKFEMCMAGKTYFSTTMFFAKSMEALKVYNRLDDDPETFYNGVMTVATGEIGYL
ncbi:MAG: DUF4364 family protein [Ruminococcaceae bacterium]|nr:DUF4364 family protein [Oscillospiraceae bacterium]